MEYQPVVDQQIEFFEPAERKEKFDTVEAVAVRERDIPERLQNREEKRAM